MVLKEIPIPAWPTHYSNAYDLFLSSSFNENGSKFQSTSFPWLRDEIRNQDSSVPLPDYFMYCLSSCARKFCNSQLSCCSSSGAKSHSIYMDNCSDCVSSDHFFRFCTKLLQWLHDPDTSHHLLSKILSATELSHAHLCISKNKINYYQEAGVICSYLIFIYSSSLFPQYLF